MFRLFSGKNVVTKEKYLESARTKLIAGQYKNAAEDCDEAERLYLAERSERELKSLNTGKAYNKSYIDGNTLFYSELLCIRGAADMVFSETQEDAYQDFNKAIEMNPETCPPRCYINRGILRHKKRNFDGAVADYTKAFSFQNLWASSDEKNLYSSVYYHRALAYKEKRAYSNVIDDCSHAIGLNPELAEAFLERSRAEKQLGKKQEAELDYNRAIQLKPSLAEPEPNCCRQYCSIM